MTFVLITYPTTSVFSQFSIGRTPLSLSLSVCVDVCVRVCMCMCLCVYVCVVFYSVVDNFLGPGTREEMLNVDLWLFVDPGNAVVKQLLCYTAVVFTAVLFYSCCGLQLLCFTAVVVYSCCVLQLYIKQVYLILISSPI